MIAGPKLDSVEQDEAMWRLYADNDMPREPVTAWPPNVDTPTLGDHTERLVDAPIEVLSFDPGDDGTDEDAEWIDA